MGDDGSDVEPALDHRRHLVPGLEHLPSVDAPEREPTENHAFQFDGSLTLQKAEQPDAAAVGHGGDHAAQGVLVAGHLEADIEALLHAEGGHRLGHAGAAHVDGE